MAKHRTASSASLRDMHFTTRRHVDLARVHSALCPA
jgi:hypothetical protein